MIGFLEGQPLKVEKGEVILNVQGVGYQLHCFENIEDRIRGQSSIQIWVYTYVKEDKIELFGFLSRKEKLWFTSLIKINGVGPRTALQILSLQKIENLARMIETEDIHGLSSLPKLGKKMAGQIILSLKGKLKKDLMPPEIKSIQNFGAREEMFSALNHWGFRREEIERAMDKIDGNMDVQQGLLRALSYLRPQV